MISRTPLIVVFALALGTSVSLAAENPSSDKAPTGPNSANCEQDAKARASTQNPSKTASDNKKFDKLARLDSQDQNKIESDSSRNKDPDRGRQGGRLYRSCEAGRKLVRLSAQQGRQRISSAELADGFRNLGALCPRRGAVV